MSEGLTYAEAAELVGVEETRIRDWKRRGLLVPIAIEGRSPRFAPEDVLRVEAGTRRSHFGRPRTAEVDSSPRTSHTAQQRPPLPGNSRPTLVGLSRSGVSLMVEPAETEPSPSAASHHVELLADGSVLLDGHPIHADEIRIRPGQRGVELVINDATIAAVLPPHYRHHIAETDVA